MADPTPEQAQQVLQQVQNPQQAAQPIRIETSTGQVFEGATQEEVLQKLVQSVENGTTHIRNLNDRLDQIQQQVQQPVQQQPTTKTPQDQYYELWQKDPIAAERFAAAQRLGLPVEMVDHVERQTILNSAATAQNNAINEFLQRCPDYPNDDANAAYLMKQQLQRQFPGQIPTADNMELAFNHLVRNGQIAPLDVPIEGYADEQSTIPRVGGGQQMPAMDFERQFRQLTPDQMKQALEQLHARGAR